MIKALFKPKTSQLSCGHELPEAVSDKRQQRGRRRGTYKKFLVIR